MVLTRKSTRARSKVNADSAEPVSEEQASVSITQAKLELTEEECDPELDELTEQVFERLTKQLETTVSQAAPSQVLELAGPIDDPFQLASSLQPELEETPYFTHKSLEVKAATTSTSSSSFCKTEVDGLLKKTVITTDFERQNGVPPIRGLSKHARAKANKTTRLASAGKGWFDMPAPILTPALKNDLKLLRMRNALDPSRHYKANDSKQLPRYFQVGRVVSGAGEFYSSRIPRRQQKQSLVEELLSNEEARAYQKKKYLELQAKFGSGTKRLRHMKHKKQFRK